MMLEKVNRGHNASRFVAGMVLGAAALAAGTGAALLGRDGYSRVSHYDTVERLPYDQVSPDELKAAQNDLGNGGLELLGALGLAGVTIAAGTLAYKRFRPVQESQTEHSLQTEPASDEAYRHSQGPSITADLLDPANPIGLTNPISPNNPTGLTNPASPNSPF